MAQITRHEDDEKVELSFKPPDAIHGSNQLRVISTDPFFEPTAEAQQRCMEYLAEQLPKNEMTSSLYKQVRFIDPGESFETVQCNLCAQVIEMEQWQAMMDSAFANGFRDLSVTTPCCKASTTLNDFDYQAPSGFAKYVIEIIDPQDPEADGQKVQPELERLLGTKLRIINAHI